MLNKQISNVANDLQLLAVQKITDPETLLDVMVRKFSEENRDEANFFVARVVMAGLKSQNTEESAEKIIGDLITEAVESADKKNTLSRGKNANSRSPSGVFIEYDDCFILLLEGFDNHVHEFIIKLEHYCHHKETLFTDVCVLYFADDVTNQVNCSFNHVDKVPGSAVEGEASEKTEEEVSAMIMEDMHNMIELCSFTMGEPNISRKKILDSARINHPLLFPRVPSIKTYLKKTDLFFTLVEYVEVFGCVPHLTRDVELNHPVEDPLKC